MVSLVTVHNYVTFNKDTFLYLVMLNMLLFCIVCMKFLCFLLLLFFSIPFVEIVSFQEPWKSVQLMIISFQ